MLKNIGSKTEKLISLYEYVVKASLTPAEPVPDKYKQAPPTTSEFLLRELEKEGLVEADETRPSMNQEEGEGEGS